MRTSSKERAEVIARLIQLGISYQDAAALRRIAGTLRNWFELECGTGDERVTRSIERDENGDGKPFLRVQFQGMSPLGKWQDIRTPIPDREAGARKRLAAIMANYKRKLVPYVQSDPRGCAIYVIRKADVRNQNIEQVYNRGVAVY